MRTNKLNPTENIPKIFIDHQVEKLDLSNIIIDSNHPRKTNSEQVEKACKLINACGMCLPIIIDQNNKVIIGNEIFEGAKILGIDKIPCIRIETQTTAQISALRTGYYKILEDGSWDNTALKIEFSCILEAENTLEIDFGPEVTGFDIAEIDIALATDDEIVSLAPSNYIPDINNAHNAVTKHGDLWLLDSHKLYCGSALEPSSYEILLNGTHAQMIFTDPPYNVPINGNVCGKGKTKHNEFLQASGEMSDQEFQDFLEQFMNLSINNIEDGALLYCCIDWRSSYDLEVAARANKLKLKNICVWNKNNGGMGSMYRSKHEFVHVYKHGTASHINNIKLGKYGRNRTNVWDFPSVNTMKHGRMKELSMHPTVKPYSLVYEAIRDCTLRGSIVLDPFVGSGTTIIAAERAHRIAYGIELDPIYVDTAIKRWQDQTGKEAMHHQKNISFNNLKQLKKEGGKDVK
ncbi:MAG: DNA modification methylase [Alphaproteobacteria bacterium]|nr:DNA modification methylase [Alphaproteobacteria bacterium]